MTQLTPISMTEAEFEQAETVIDTGLKTFVDVGRALLSIRDDPGRVYKRYAGYSTFEDYCRDRWNLTQPRAYQLIDAARVVDALETSTVVEVPPIPERQLRELAPLLRRNPEFIPAAWQEAVETAPNGQVTAAHVADVVERHQLANYSTRELRDAIAERREQQALEKGPKPVPESGSRELGSVQFLRFCQADMPTATIVSIMLIVFFPDAKTALDMTYGSGAFWDGSAHVSVTAVDINPSRAPGGAADFKDLKYPNAAFDVALFDPPHIADAGVNSIMGARFGTYSDEELPDVIRAGAWEAMRVARLGAIIKVTDHVHGQRFVRESGWVIAELGEPYDMVHQTRSAALIDPKWEDRLSPDNNGSTYLIFRHGDNRHIRRGTHD